MADASESNVTLHPLDVHIIEAQKEWAQSWQSLCHTARTIEEDCVQERARLKSLLEDSDSEKLDWGICIRKTEEVHTSAYFSNNGHSENRSLDCTESVQCLYPEVLWLELVHLRSQVRGLRQVGHESELVQSPVERLEPYDVMATLQTYKEKLQQELAQIELLRQESEISLISIDTFCESFAPSPSPRIARSQSAGSLGERRWRGPRGGDGSFYQSGRCPAEAFLTSPSPLPEKRLHSKSALKKLMKHDEILEGLRNALQSLDDDIKKHASMLLSWPSGEHEAFMRVFRMFRRQSSSLICDRLVEKFPNATRESIASHLSWCIRCEEQQAMKRELLSKWRERIVVLDLEAAKAGEATLKEQDLQSSRMLGSRSETLRKQIKEWHRSKEEAAAQAAALEQKLKQDKAKREKADKKKRVQERESKRCLVKEFQEKRSKSLEELRAQACKRSEPLRLEERKRIEKRTAEMLRKRIEAFTALREADMQRWNGRCAEMEWKDPKYGNVPSRLYETTISSQAKVRSQEPELEIPELEVPSGRCAETEWKNPKYDHVPSRVYETTASWQGKIRSREAFKEPEFEASLGTFLPIDYFYEAWNPEEPVSFLQTSAENRATLEAKLAERSKVVEARAADVEARAKEQTASLQTLAEEKAALEATVAEQSKFIEDLEACNPEQTASLQTMAEEKAALEATIAEQSKFIEDFEAWTPLQTANLQALAEEKAALEATVAEQNKFIEARAADVEASASEQRAALQTLFEEKEALKQALEAQVATVETLEAKLTEQRKAMERQAVEVEATDPNTSASGFLALLSDSDAENDEVQQEKEPRHALDAKRNAREDEILADGAREDTRTLPGNKVVAEDEIEVVNTNVAECKSVAELSEDIDSDGK